MKNFTFAIYLKEALSPGGTPARYLLWVCIILVAQTFSSILPSPYFYKSYITLPHIIIGAVLLYCFIVLSLKKTSHKIYASYFSFIIGLFISSLTIATGITPLAGIIFMVTWSMTLFVAERREYISFDLVTLFMILMLASSVISLMNGHLIDDSFEPWVLGTGALLTTINIYLVYADFGFERNFYQSSRKTVTNLEELSTKLSNILSSDGELENLLWEVTQECVPFLEIEECVIYLFDEKRNLLIQTAAFGEKSNSSGEIINPLEISPGKGVVGAVFETGRYYNVDETRRNPDYIVDDIFRNSELAVPIKSNGKIIGVLDSEHSKPGFFLQRHEQAFHIIAAFCGIKIMEFNSRKAIEQGRMARTEALHYKELNDMKTRFIMNVSHDLKTPLSLIKAPAMQLSKTSTDKNVIKQANYILKSTNHLIRVVQQLLNLNSVEKGLKKLDLKEVSVHKLVSELAEQYLGLAKKNNILFSYKVEQITMLTDSFLLEQIIHNVVHNAFRYTSKGGG